MFKRIFGVCLFALLISTSAFALPDADKDIKAAIGSACVPAVHPLAYQPGFRSYFEKTARCTCREKGLPTAYCNSVSMETLYNYMISIYHSLPEACTKQFDVPVQECIDDWNCFRLGGVDSGGRACSKTMA